MNREWLALQRGCISLHDPGALEILSES